MPYIKPGELYAQMRAKKFLPVYIFAGDEPYLLQEALQSLEKSLNVSPLCREVFFGNETHVHEIILATQTMPFMSDRRFLIVKDADRFKKADSEKLAEFLKNPVESSCLVLIWKEKLRREDKNSELFSSIDASGAVVEFRTLYEKELPGWISDKIKSHGKKITPDAAQYLISESGPNLLDIENEIDKLSLFCGSKETIQLGDAQQSSGHSRQANLYELAEAVEGRKADKAVMIIERLLSDGEIPLKALAAVYRSARRMLTAKCLMEENKMSADEIRQELRLSPYFDRNFFSNLARYSLGELKQAAELIMSADMELKTSTRPEQYVLEELIISLTKK